VDNIILPEKELYIRWLQLVSFLPAMRFKHLPSEYRDEKLSKMSMKLSSERHKTLKPIFDSYLHDALSEGLPFIRPLWMLDPTDAACLDVVDEFSIGEQVIVAPILKQNQTIREGEKILN
jgi:myogenesis-regulating glycosidase